MVKSEAAGRVALKVDVALVHYPVANRNGETIGSAVTNLDIHDIARAGRTFGIDTFYLVTPFTDQQKMVAEILAHWQTGYGATYNPMRREALSLVRLCPDLADLYRLVEEKWQRRPLVLATSARERAGLFDFAEVRERIFAGEPVLLLFGTGWGMTAEALADVDGFLPPIGGFGEYNHLSVRSAAAIVFDRLLARR